VTLLYRRKFLRSSKKLTHHQHHHQDKHLREQEGHQEYRIPLEAGVVTSVLVQPLSQENRASQVTQDKAQYSNA
jgi:hypothetical protein